MVDQQLLGSEPRQLTPGVGFRNCRPNPTGRLMGTAVLALSVGTTLAIVNAQTTNNLNLHRALVCFAFAIPASSLYLFLWSAAENRPVYPDTFTKLVAVLGMILGVVGFGFAISSITPGVGALFGIAALGFFVLAMRAEEKGKKGCTESGSAAE